jgi:type I restriction enzyme S subunit
MSVGWTRTRLGAAFTTMTGSTPPKAHAALFGKYMPLVKPPELRDGPLDSAEDGLSESGARGARTLPVESVLVSCIGNLGKVGINTVPVAFNQQINAVLPNRATALPEFMFYQALCPVFKAQLESLATGTTVRIVNKSRFNELEIVLPPLAEQRRIVAILDEAFEGIATAKANAEKNLQNARELAEALGEECFDQHIDDSFRSRDLASLCEFIVDCEHKTAPTQDHGYPSIRTPNVGKGKLVLDDLNRVSEETYAAWTRRAVPRPGDLILAREAPAGNVTVIPDGMQVCLGQRTVLIRPRREVFEPQYLVHLLLQRNSQQRLLAHSRGATVQHINMKDIRAFMITSVPARAVQTQVVERLADIDQACESLAVAQRKKLTALYELKKSLLHQAFTGALTAESTDTQLAEVA